MPWHSEKEGIQTEMDEEKEGTMKKQQNIWTACKTNARNNIQKRNMVLAEKS